MARVEVQSIISNNERFTIVSYNGIEVIKRDSDGFINVTKMCKQLGKKEFYRINDNGSWKEFYSEMIVTRKIEEPIYVLKKNHSNDIRGTYIHPSFVNYIAMWASSKYAVYVCEIMDLINERNQLTNQDLNDTINQLQNEIETLKSMNLELKSMNLELKAESEKRLQEIQRQNIHIFKTSVPIDNSTKKLQILRLNDNYRAPNDNPYIYKIIADSTHRAVEICRLHQAQRIHKQFTVPAGMNLKQMIKDKYDYKYYFNDDNYENILGFIRLYNVVEEW